MRAADYIHLWVIALIMAGTILAVRLVITARRHDPGPRHRGSPPIAVRVGRFIVTAGSAVHRSGSADGCVACAFVDAGDASLVARVGVAAVMADGRRVPCNRGVAIAAVNAFVESVRHSAPTAVSVMEVLRGALLRANERLFGFAALSSQSSPAIGAVAVTASGLYWISAGGVRIYLVRERTAWRVDRDHAGPAPAPESAAGSVLVPEVDAAPAALPLQPGDYIIVCNAGLHSRLTEDVIARGVVEHGSDCSRALVDSVGSLDGATNLSAFHLGIQ